MNFSLRKYRTKTTRFLFFLIADIVFIFLSVWLSFFLKFDYSIPSQYLTSVWRLSVLSIFFIVPIFYLHGLYTFSWSFVSTKEVISIVRSLTLSFIFMAAVIFLSKDFYAFIGFPRSVLLINYFLVFLFTGGVRFAKRIYVSFSNGRSPSEQERTLIVGAGDTGEQILRGIQTSHDSPYFPVGFVDDSKMKENISIHGVKVLGKISDIPEIVKNHSIEQLVIALPSAGSKVIRDAVDLGRRAGIKKIKIFPPLSDIVRGNVTLGNLKTVEAEDLLGRDSINVDTTQISNLIKGNAVLITGAAGSIGSELVRQTARFAPEQIILLDQDETGIFTVSNQVAYTFPDIKLQSVVADITDKAKMQTLFSQYRPNIVFHAAAYKHVPLMEENPDEAVKNNIFGTETLAEAAVRNGVKKYIFISTDKAVNPTSVMGATKRIGEMICQAYNQRKITQFVSVRFGNVLDSRGSVIPIFREQIKKGGPVEVTHPDMRRYFMLNSEACLLVMQAAAMGQGGEVFVLDMGKMVKILDLAREMIRLSGFEPDKDIAIVFKGMRPGEKLFEEILTAEEGTVATRHQKIFTAQLSGWEESECVRNLQMLKEALGRGGNIVEQLKKITPFYQENQLKTS